jgi:hypothetical protein
MPEVMDLNKQHIRHQQLLNEWQEKESSIIQERDAALSYTSQLKCDIKVCDDWLQTAHHKTVCANDEQDTLGIIGMLPSARRSSSSITRSSSSILNGATQWVGWTMTHMRTIPDEEDSLEDKDESSKEEDIEGNDYYSSEEEGSNTKEYYEMTYPSIPEDKASGEEAEYTDTILKHVSFAIIEGPSHDEKSDKEDERLHSLGEQESHQKS